MSRILILFLVLAQICWRASSTGSTCNCSESTQIDIETGLLARIAALTAAFNALSVQNTSTSYIQIADATIGVKAPLNATFYFRQFGFHGTVRIISENGTATINGSNAFIEFPFTMPASLDSGISGYSFWPSTGTQLVVGEILISGFASGTVKAIPQYFQSTNKLRLLLPSLPDNPLTTSPYYKIDGTNNTIAAANTGRNISIIGGLLTFFDDFGLSPL